MPKTLKELILENGRKTLGDKFPEAQPVAPIHTLSSPSIHLHARCLFDQMSDRFTDSDLCKITELIHKKALAQQTAAAKLKPRFMLVEGEILQGIQSFWIFDTTENKYTSHRVLDRETGLDVIKMLTRLHSL